MTAKLDIENKIRALMLAAGDPLDALKVVIRGVAYRVPTALYPFAQVFITDEVTESELTGAYKERVYRGVISIHVQQGDALVVASRAADIASYTAVQALIDATVKLLSTPANSTLGGLVFTNGHVTHFVVGENPVEYGVADMDARENNYENYGAIPFVARTLEVIA